MDDNSRPHRAHLVNEFIHDNNIARLEWPACSPDMNPIEHAWDTLKRAVFGRDDPLINLRDLRRIAVEEWDNRDQQDLGELVDICHDEYRQSSFSNLSVASLTLPLILQHFCRFFYITGSSLTSLGEPPI